jgi:hypothetical protein
MLKLLQELIKGNELTISLTRVTAKGGLAVLLAFIFATIVFFCLVW